MTGDPALDPYEAVRRARDAMASGLRPFAADQLFDATQRDLLARLARGLDVPPWIVGLGSPPEPAPKSRRERAAARVGQAGWRIGYTVAQTGRFLERAGDRLIDAGDWLAGKVAGRD